MFRDDIVRFTIEKYGMGSNMPYEGLFTGQTIKQSEIINLSSYKLMNENERGLVGNILDELKTQTETQKGVALTKRMDTLVPRSETTEPNNIIPITNYKDVHYESNFRDAA